MLPNLIVIGAGKSGTSALYHYLGEHPEITMSRIKELRFFNGQRWDKGVDWYASNWAGSSTPVRGEATPAYTQYPKTQNVPERMHAVVPEARLVYIVRDPIDRILSNYVDDRSWAVENRKPSELWPSSGKGRVAASCYALQLERYLPYFPMEQILVVSHEELLSRRRETLGEVFRFLGVDGSFDSPNFDVLRNVSAEKREMRWKSRWLPSSLNPKGAPHFFSWQTRKRVKRAVLRPLSAPVEWPTLDAAQRDAFAEVLKPEADRLRQLTGKAFEDWSV